MHYVYVLKFYQGDKWYIGYTNNLQRRIKEHQKEWKHKFKLLYYEAYQSEKLARIREIKLKYYGSAWRALKARIIA